MLSIGFVYKYACAAFMVIIFWDFLIFYQIFLLPQVKWSVVIINNNVLHELLHELPRDFRKYQENFKTSWNYSLVVILLKCKFCE